MRELERRFPEELVVVGVHSGKFPAERVTANIRAALARLAVAHPVVNDRQYRTWRAYAVNAWPTLVLVDPAGYVLGEHVGEATPDQLAPVIARTAADATARGTLDRAPRSFPAESPPGGMLAFPQKLALDAQAARLAVADTGHDRILVVRLEADRARGWVEAVVGSGQPGLVDGTLEAARFHSPHGLAFLGERLLVADMENHAVREVDLAAGRVRTLAGHGEPARQWPPRGGVGPHAALSSPWDLLVIGDTVHIAMTGSHQLWRLHLTDGHVQPWVGTGEEALRDGLASAAALAQPSGLASDGRRLFFADSESSAVRWAALDDGRTGTIVGTGLFDFGDRDGVGDAVCLQHPLGVAWNGRELLVADTYNDASKRIDPATRAATTRIPGDAGVLWQPGGIAATGEEAWIADSNHHRVILADAAGGAWRELEIRGG